tara:strand:- start:13 stop:309 length:297 start_codon:yes stop_codon:yes gene_type:complete
MTLAPETLLLALNGIILSLAYFLIYPRMVGADINKLMQSDLLATATSVIVAGFLFWGTNHPFDLLFGQVNWFAFSVVTFLLMEVPFALWYLKKFDAQM